MCMRGRMTRFLANVCGNAAVSFAVAAPALFSALGLASDFAIFSMKRSELQAMADQAAILSANELSVGNTSKTTISSAVAAYKDQAIGDQSRDVTPASSVGDDATSVTVKLTEEWTPFFAHYIGVDVTPIMVSATASLVGESKICVLALEAKNMGALSMSKSARIQANGCSIYSNSTSSSGVFLSDQSEIEADLVCSAGGVSGYGVNSAEKVMQDCPPIADPLASRPPPPVGACDFNNFSLAAGTKTLQPGVYCGGINLSGTAKVKFEPGDYIIKDGPFSVRQNAEASGSNVAFYLTGAPSTIWFLDNAAINFSGAETGPMAGLLFFEDPKSSPLRLHTIGAARAETLTGTIYLPRGNLVVDPNSSVGAKSAYTAIVARRVIVSNGPTLVLNSDYSATKVPVPAGVRVSSNVVLTD